MITHDGTIDMATGRDRNTKNWKNKAWQWSTLLAKLAEPVQTYEPYKEYMAAAKSRQDEIKDVGGFVGGYLTGGRRGTGSVAHRQLLTLDLDTAAPDFWDTFTLLYGNAAAMYSTHKHCPDKPRLRLLVPLDREVSPDEYEAIARKLAGELDIEMFDPTTFQPSRLMFWPSVSKDGEFLYKYKDAPWLSADSVLAEYRDWRDTSEWPVSVKVDKVARAAMKKQGDPLEKEGLVGAFCRTYDIHQVIELFLSDVYEPCETEGRYTFKEGSTSGGLVTYDDKFAFSHHGTDPASGKLCNAFDLVRLHLYCLKDEDAREDTPPNRLPSFTAMSTLCMKDKAVRGTLVTEKVAGAKSDFEGYVTGDDTEEAEESTEWMEQLDVDKKGEVYASPKNIKILLENDPRLSKGVMLDLFDQRVIVTKNLPWRKVLGVTEFTNADDSCLRNYLSEVYGISGKSIIDDALIEVTNRNAVHSVKDYLSPLQWDGIPRLDTLFIDYLGAHDNVYTRAVTRKAFAAAVARVFEPGVKFDTMLVLAGKQGAGKSTILRKLGRRWFNESFSFKHLHHNPDKASEQLQGVWIVEVAELSGIRLAEVEDIKNFLSRTSDRYRVIFKPRTEPFPRQCVFFGTTNSDAFLKDSTGNRRFWPVAILKHLPAKCVFKDLTDDEATQIWAEAVRRYNDKEELHLSGAVAEMAEKAQSAYTERDQRTGFIQKFLDTLLPDDWDSRTIQDRRDYFQAFTWDEAANTQDRGTLQRRKICAAEIWCEAFGKDLSKLDIIEAKKINDIMKGLGNWEPITTLRFGVYGRLRGYRRVLANDNTNSDEPSTLRKSKC